MIVDDAEHYDIQHNDVQHKGLNCDTQHFKTQQKYPYHYTKYCILLLLS